MKRAINTKKVTRNKTKTTTGIQRQMLDKYPTLKSKKLLSSSNRGCQYHKSSHHPSCNAWLEESAIGIVWGVGG
jgi:hypothetical protein